MHKQQADVLTAQPSPISVKASELGDVSSVFGKSAAHCSASIVLTDKNDIDDVKHFAYAVCREYLSGAWKQIDLADFKIDRLSGGLSNYLYKCEIDEEKFSRIGNEPSRILLRLYGENHQKNSSILLKDVVVSAIMGDNQLGPKLYGLFPNGRLEELINASSMEQTDMYDPELSRSIANVMARFHTLEMPFIKEPKWLFDTTIKYMKRLKELTFSDEKDIKRFNQFKSYNLENEFNELRVVLEASCSPVVFCHNDINTGNILKFPHKLMVIDYEYGSYNYRGFDFGNHFCEWMFNNNHPEYPYFAYNYERYPNREQQANFLHEYIRQFRLATCARRHSSANMDRLDDDEYSNNNNNNNNNNNDDDDDNDENASSPSNVSKENNQPSNGNAHSDSPLLDNLSEEQLITESNNFALASHLFWAFWSVSQASVCKIRFEYLDYALARVDAYFRQKKLFFPNGFGCQQA